MDWFCQTDWRALETVVNYVVSSGKFVEPDAEQSLSAWPKNST